MFILRVSILLLLVGLFKSYPANAQKRTEPWRITKKIRTEANGQKSTTEYSYTNDGRIQTVKYISAAGTVSIIISDFKFENNEKPIAYSVYYGRDPQPITVTIRYDKSGRITELIKTISQRDITSFTYRYTGNTVLITEQKTVGESTFKDNRFTFYTEEGDFAETSGDAATQVVTSTVKLNEKRNPELEPYPTKFMGGFEAPMFLGVTAYGSEPQTSAEKNTDGLITSLSFVTRTSTRKNEYTYTKIGEGRIEPVETGPKIIITTNINCTDGKLIVERILKSQEGVKSAVVDIASGKLALDYSTDGTPYAEIIRLINEAGFDADTKKSTSPDKNPCVIILDPGEKITKIKGRNIFDAKKNFAKAPIKFVPFVVTPDAAQKGFKMDSIYIWTAPDGKTKQASGAEILKQVNEMEKELCIRGHTLRKKNAFSGLSYRLINPNALLKVPPAVIKTSKIVKPNIGMGNYVNKIPIIKTKHNKLPDISSTTATTIGGDVGIYFGNINANSGEFQGIISTTGTIDNTNCTTQCPLDVTLSLDAKMIKSLNITNCVLEISANPNRKPNDFDDAVLATANFNFKTPAKAKYGLQNVTINGDAPPSFHTLYYFPVKINDLSKLAKATLQPALYYAYVKFYNDKGQLLYYSSYNTAILENKIDVPIFIAQEKNVTAGFSDAFTDPTGLFGMYYKSNKLNATYTTKRDDATLIITENTKLSGDVEIGAQYYNFWYLLDNDQPKFTQKSFISTNFSSEYTKQYKAGPPKIRIPGNNKSNDMNSYIGYQVNYSLYNGEENSNYNKASNYTETKSVGYNIFDERFFIGPVPCRIKVDVKGNATFTRQATMDTLSNGNVSISTSITPHLDLTLTGEGGVDAAIAYAKIVADVKVIEVDLPISVKASKDADLQADLKITALSGQIYFTAGLCIPIPWFDDICTDFRVDIFNWTGPSKTYPLVK